ncbi:MAG: sugar transferase [Elusimicrobia bacterium]|nr:sugar transferase [Elusimicrobiota bacterium]
MKRLFDIFGAAAGLILTAPIFLSLGLWMLIKEGRPLFYRGLRSGLGGKSFRIFKFRTMVVNADKIGGPSTSDDDPRLTTTGLFLRKYKLDELPQLFNVLTGDMSFVGPRPEVPEETALYNEEEKFLLSVRPGITDYASMKFHNEGEILKGSKDPHEAYRRLIRPEKIRLGLDYVKNRSLKTDFKILAATLATLVDSRLISRRIDDSSGNSC